MFSHITLCFHVTLHFKRYFVTGGGLGWVVKAVGSVLLPRLAKEEYRIGFVMTIT